MADRYQINMQSIYILMPLQLSSLHHSPTLGHAPRHTNGKHAVNVMKRCLKVMKHALKKRPARQSSAMKQLPPIPPELPTNLNVGGLRHYLQLLDVKFPHSIEKKKQGKWKSLKKHEIIELYKGLNEK